ncbi:WD40-repeat-containing domain protein [Gorgonomyces haynaldii]|nr:WD40-repeat-containing domain protein [Gorgonomyces haynaldii]
MDAKPPLSRPSSRQAEQRPIPPPIEILDSHLVDKKPTKKERTGSTTSQKPSSSRKKSIKKERTPTTEQTPSTAQKTTADTHSPMTSRASTPTNNETKEQLRKKVKKLSSPVDTQIPSPSTPSKKHRKVKKKTPTVQEASPTLFDHLNVAAQDYKNMISQINIYRTDSLVSHAYLRHPLVKIHIIDLDTGEYLKKSDPERPVTKVNEPAHINYILPVITKPFDLHHNHTKTPIWNESMVLNESFLHLTRPNVLILFEILDFITHIKATKSDPWHRVCWGFLKVVGPTGRANVDTEARLQLYKYPWTLIKHKDELKCPYVYKCWKMEHKKYPSTLFVKLTTHTELEREITHTRAQLPLDPKWKRQPGQHCSIPNKLMYQIDVGLRGAFSCKFSKSGLFLAVSGVELNTYPIKIYQIMTGDRIATLEGHQDLVYQLDWSQNDEQLLSVSSDGTARLWEFKQDGTVHEASILPHPSYVYCGLYYPKETTDNTMIIATGCFDGGIRFWEAIGKKKPKPKKTFMGHKSHVNTICFDGTGQKMFTGDGHGTINIWSSFQSKLDSVDELHFECIKTVETHSQAPVHWIGMHPSQRKIVIQTAQQTHVMDTRIFRFTSTFQEPLMEHKLSRPLHRGCISPCGSWTLSMHTDQVLVWRTDTGLIHSEYSSKSLSNWSAQAPIVDIDFHPYEHMVAFARFGKRQTVDLYQWDDNLKPMGLKTVPCLILGHYGTNSG